MKKQFYLVRHGESEANTLPIFQGTDTPLTELGKKQALLVAERASRLPVEVVISSDITRAKQTAEIIVGKTGHPLTFSSLFHERRKPSVVNNRPHVDLEAAKIFSAWEESLFEDGPKVFDGETFDEMHQRARDALHFLSARSESNVLVVTHGMFMRMLVGTVLFGDECTSSLLGNLKKNISISNTGVTLLEYNVLDANASWKLITWNDRVHLG